LGISIIFSALITLFSGWIFFLFAFISIFFILLINTFAKKIAGYYFELDVETKLWEFKRWGWKPEQKFKKSFLAGIFIPIISRIIFFPLNGFIWMASIVFDVKIKISRSAKRHGFYSFSEVNESHLAYIATAGILANFIFLLLAYFLFESPNFANFAKWSIWFIFFNLIPISNLDGNKIFFGNRVLWSFLAVVATILLLATFWIV